MFARKSIYVVDDDSSMRRSMERLLRKHGFDAVAFESAGALLRYGCFEEACCIVLDINLDGESGISLRRRLASEGTTVPVIYITGNDCHANQAAAMQSGCAAYLAKPFAASALIDSIERVCAKDV
ncbi:response regulator transcription factor [Bradyrhizobium cytisi]|uniref:Response regulator n=1 Tax=Bradyrhizobium cytisi TaxID=515489 RepID=A0A5S4WP96_9BRAD|nr:response regulator [Bradyrhizobium cytisi]TYL83383.1 response regulator [Bradyrhizobium cytisi]